jgi:ribosomal-protein-alanine N-acetyltransferase
VVDSPGPAVRIVQLDLATLRALADGDLGEAQRHVRAPLTPYLVEPDSRHLWQMRVGQVARDPGSAAWVTGIVVDERTGRVVGRAGFHGPPDDAGMVEVGYSIDTAERRRGYARAAAEPDVRVVRASVSPDNAVSRGLVLGHGFVEVGDQWDDEDGLEIVYEVPAGGPHG